MRAGKNLKETTVQEAEEGEEEGVVEVMVVAEVVVEVKVVGKEEYREAGMVEEVAEMKGVDKGLEVAGVLEEIAVTNPRASLLVSSGDA